MLQSLVDGYLTSKPASNFNLNVFHQQNLIFNESKKLKCVGLLWQKMRKMCDAWTFNGKKRRKMCNVASEEVCLSVGECF